MEVFEALRTRSSVRDYREEPVPPEKLLALQEAALLAPTSLNLQEQTFCFITDKAILDQLAAGVIEVSRRREEWDYLERLRQREGKVFFGAPLLIVIAIDPKNHYTGVDAGIAAQSIALAAKDQGLDSVIMAAPDRIFLGEDGEAYGALVGIPPGYRFAISLAVGYAAHPFAPHELKRENIRLIQHR